MTCRYLGIGILMKKSNREIDIWISVSQDLKKKYFVKPIKDGNTLIWIHKYFDRQYDADVSIFNYDIYSSELDEPIQLKEGNFICVRLADYCKSIGCGNHYSIRFDIIDKMKELRSFFGLGQGEDGIIKIIIFLRKLAKYEDWTEFDLKKKIGTEPILP